MFRPAIRKDLRTARERVQLRCGILHSVRSKPRASDQENPDICAQLVLHMAIRLAQEALRAAAHGGTAEFFPGGKADLARDATVTQDLENHAPPCNGGTFLIDMLKVTAALDHLGARQCVFFLIHR